MEREHSAIRLEGVSHGYPQGGRLVSVLEDVDLAIAPGELVVVVGRSGSGKSTLLNLISGIDLPRSGRVWLGEHLISDLDEEQRATVRRRHVGIVFQFFNLIPTLTGLENVLFPMELNRMPERQSDDRALELLDLAEVGHVSDRLPGAMSGGEQQRVAIARALAHDPEVILADEPTGSLDLETGLQVLDLLDELVREQGKTLVMVTHSREVMGVADRLLEVRGGGLIPGDPNRSDP